MKKIRIAYGGGRSLGVQTLQWLSSQNQFDVVAVCPVPYESDPDYYNDMMSIIREKGYPICTVEELMDCKIDIGLSVNYHQIIREDILCHCTKGFYNIHHSYNLRLRGRNITTHAILNTVEENIFYHGTTLHQMAPELDAGGIIASEAFSIEKNDTAYTLFRKADEKALCMIKEWLPRIAFESVFPYAPPSGQVHVYKNADLPERIITDSMSTDYVNAMIRAFDYPGKEPAYLISNMGRKHLVFSQRDQYQKEYLFAGNTYYTD